MDVAALRKRLNIPAGLAQINYDKDVFNAVKNFQRKRGLTADGILGAGTRRALNHRKGMNRGSPSRRIAKILINMERWRWMPRDLAGDANIYVWANLPEQHVRIIKNGEVAFKERMVAGKVNRKTPIFSDSMEWIEIHPTWYLPNSIKVADILPDVRRSGRMSKRYRIKINCFGQSGANVDWKKVDIRKCSVTQPPGARSVLGDFKFKFPNKHAVYMHDTLTKGLFQRQTRFLSHGCMRIRNPRRMAEVLLGHDKGMSSSRIGAILRGPKRLHKEVFKRAVPVHVTYFTARPGKNGKVLFYPDYYGHDRRLGQALLGKGHLFSVPAIATAKRRRPPRRKKPKEDWRQNLISIN